MRTGREMAAEGIVIDGMCPRAVQRKDSEIAGEQRVAQFAAPDGWALLSGGDREYFVEIVESSLAVRSMPQFFLWTQGPVQRLLPHEILVFGSANSGTSSIGFRKLASTRYFTEQHFNDVCRPGAGLVPRIMARWTHSGAPILLSRELRTAECEGDWLKLAAHHELCNVAAHGMRSVEGRINSFFCFARVEGEFGLGLHRVLWLLVAHLHETLARVMFHEQELSARPVSPKSPVTDREAEVLRWVRDGKTNRAIADILDVSPYTVKNHIQKILKKMGVANRSHAVSRAINVGILPSAGP